MKPLVFYCRWQSTSLRLRGRSDTAVWGELVFKDESENETTQEFQFYLGTSELTLRDPDGDKILILDEMGVVKTQ